MAADGIQADGLVKRFGETTALDGVSFEAGRGEVLGLLGPNGAGKTTAVSVLATLLRPDAGTATVDGHDVVADPASVRRSIALTGQFAALDEALTGHENLTLFGRLRGLSRSAAQARAAELLERFDLVDAADGRVSSYSGGMRRRLDLAASLVDHVPILFLDEPTTGLDPRSRATLWEMVRELRSEGRTIILTTQYLEEADQLADRIVLIDNGRVVVNGTPDDLKRTAGGQSCVVAPVDPGRLDEVAKLLDERGAVAVDLDLGIVTIPDTEAADLSAILQRLAQAGIEVADVSLRRPTLDEVFLDLTGGSS
ncbi:MAG: ATP-binding cassette domain-containing protein [Actinomycetota bacterium]